MPRPTNSKLSDKAALEAAIALSDTKKEVLERIGLRAAGGNYKQLHYWADIHGLTLPHGIGKYQTIQANLANLRPYDEVFCENSTYHNRESLKKRLRKVWVNWNCVACGLGEVWNEKPITLQLEHKNGVWNDNRMENLCLLCPNCHSQTETFAGRNHTLVV